MNQKLIEITKTKFYYCPVCDKKIELQEGILSCTCWHCNHKLEIVKTKSMNIDVTLSVKKNSIYCPECSHGLETKSITVFSKGIFYNCINPDCKLCKNNTQLKKTNYINISDDNTFKITMSMGI